MSEQVRQIAPPDEELTEYWQRYPEQESYLRGVEVYTGTRIEGWQVKIRAGEYFREDPMGVELEQHIGRALRAVPGVSEVKRIGWESWDVNGSPSGEALCQAVASVLDELIERMRGAYEEM